jgi:hypothetical protein
MWGERLGWESNCDWKDKERVGSTGWRVVTKRDAQNRHEHRNAFPILKKNLFCSKNLRKRVKKYKITQNSIRHGRLFSVRYPHIIWQYTVHSMTATGSHSTGHKSGQTYLNT